MTELKKGEIKCSQCNGSGTIQIVTDNIICSKCHGTGKLDWIENIVGKPTSITYMDNFLHSLEKNRKEESKL